MPFGKPEMRALPPQSPAPTQAAPEVELARKNQREKMLRAKGRAASQLTSPGLLGTPNLRRPTLKDTLG